MPRLIRRNPEVKVVIKRVPKIIRKTIVKKIVEKIRVVKEKLAPKKRVPYAIEIFDDKAGKPRWRLVSTNGNILATSEAYERKGTRTRIANNLAKGLGLDGVEESENTKLS